MAAISTGTRVGTQGSRLTVRVDRYKSTSCVRWVITGAREFSEAKGGVYIHHGVTSSAEAENMVCRIH